MSIKIGQTSLNIKSYNNVTSDNNNMDSSQFYSKPKTQKLLASNPNSIEDIMSNFPEIIIAA